MVDELPEFMPLYGVDDTEIERNISGFCIGSSMSSRSNGDGDQRQG